MIAGFAADMKQVERCFGAGTAGDLWRWTVDGVAAVRRGIERYGIACDWRSGHLVAAARPRHADELKRYADYMSARYDAPVDYLDAASGAVAGGSYHGYYRDRGGGHLHPLNYTLGLARAAVEAGVDLCAPVNVKGVRPGRVTEVVTDRGTLRCDHVLVCVNAWMGPSCLGARTWQLPVASHIVATAPLAPDRRADLVLDGAAVEDTRRLLNYFRVSADGRLLFGGRVGLMQPSAADCHRVLGRRIEALFPQLGPIRTEYAWGGEVAITTSLMPHLDRSGPVYQAHGFCGHGMALSGLAGRILAEAVTGDAARLDILARAPNRARRLPVALRRPAIALALLWYRLIDAL